MAKYKLVIPGRPVPAQRMTRKTKWTDYGMNNKWVECPIKKKRFTAVGEMPDKCKLFAGG